MGDRGEGYQDYLCMDFPVYFESFEGPEPTIQMESEAWEWITRARAVSLDALEVLPLINSTELMFTSEQFHQIMSEQLTVSESLIKFGLDAQAREYCRAASRAGLRRPSLWMDGLRNGIPLEYLAVSI